MEMQHDLGSCKEVLRHTSHNDELHQMLIRVCVLSAVVTVIHVLGILFVIVAGMTQAQPLYVHPFAPFGVRGIFDGATTAFFAFIGADALANTAEEVSLLICTCQIRLI